MPGGGMPGGQGGGIAGQPPSIAGQDDDGTSQQAPSDGFGQDDGSTGDGQMSAPPGGGSAGGGSSADTGGGNSPGGAGGGLLDASTPSDDLVALLTADADQYTWAAATVGAQSAAGYQLATGLPVMSLGGFNGSDPYPALEEFQAFVYAGEVHYFIAGGEGMGGGGNGGGESSSISSWVSENYEAQTVGGVTVYDLSSAST